MTSTTITIYFIVCYSGRCIYAHFSPNFFLVYAHTLPP